MIFRFTLSNSILGTQVINEPDGWKNPKLKLERNKDYHCLIQSIDTQFFFYNKNNLIDGGRQFITTVESTQGINAIISLLIELTEDGTNYDQVFSGNLDLSTIKDISRGNKFYKFQCNIIPSDLWATFINRKSIAIDLMSTSDLDGGAEVAPTIRTLNLTSQVLKEETKTQINNYNDASPILTGGWALDSTNKYTSVDLPVKVLDELKDWFDLPGGASSIIPSEFFRATEDGTYDITIDIILANNDPNPGHPKFGVNGDMFIAISNSLGTTTTALTKTVLGTGGVDQCTRFKFSTTGYAINSGGTIQLYFEYTSAGTAALYYVVYGGLVVNPDTGISFIQSFVDIVGNTTYPQTTTQSLLLYDAADSLLVRMTNGKKRIYSEYLGGAAQGYGVNGCGYLNAIMKGLHVRGYTFAQKPFSMSFDDWWNGANPILNLGLGPEVVSGVEKLRIEQKDHFYNDTPILTFDFVNNIERTYDQSMIFKSITNGYKNWSAESLSGIDDPQTKHQHSTVYKLIGIDVDITSSFIAAALAIEQTRRNTKLTNKDWRLDNDVLIINLSDLTTPEIGSPFTSITNLFNATTRYNIRLTPYRNFQRWIKYFSNCVQAYLSNKFKFNSGEGNYTMTVGANSDTCDTGTWTENQDISPSSSPYFTAQMYRFVVPMSWSDYKLWMANKYQALAVSPTDSNHKTCHVSTAEYDFEEVTITGWIK